MEQHGMMQGHEIGTSLQLAWGTQVPLQDGTSMKLPNIAEKLQNDEQAMREWCAKIAEIRRKSTL